MKCRLAVAAFTCALLVSATAVADPTKDECVAANESAQALRKSGQLRIARAQLLTCVAKACPGLIRDDCAERLTELDGVMPTIVFDVKDGSGNDVTAVAVDVDGATLTANLGGSALAVDPGEHVFTFTASGQTPVKKTYVLKEGEKGRRERVIVGSAVALSAPPPGRATQRAAPPPPPPPDASSTSESPSGLGTRKIIGLTLGGVGVVGVGVGAVFGLIASSRWTTAKGECPSHVGCSQQAISDRNGAAGSATVSTVSFVAGGILAAAGVSLFLTAPNADQPSVGIMATPGAIAVAGRF